MDSEASSIYSRPMYTGRPDPQVPNFLTLPIARSSRPEKILEALSRDTFYTAWVWPFKKHFPWMTAPLPTTHVSTKIEKFKSKLARARTWTVRIRSACYDSDDHHRERLRIWGHASERYANAKRELPRLKQLKEYLIRMGDRLDDIEKWAIYWEYAECVPSELRVAMRWAYQWIEKLDMSLIAFDQFYARLDLLEEEARARDPRRAARKRAGGSAEGGDRRKGSQKKKTLSWGAKMGEMLCGGVHVE